MFVGPAVDRWCGNTDLEAMTVGTIDPVPTGFRLDVYRQQQVFTVPLVPVCRQGTQCSSGMISMRTTCRPIMANSGERSMPESGGMMRWMGLSIGLVRLYRSEVTGL